jgi:SAM-dependent methyltransferase
VLDLCLDAGGASGAYKEPPAKSGTRLFQSELISSVYENGWRQSFAWAGFPGEEEETRYAMEYMLSNGFGAEGSDSILLDVSCGSGLFSRRFASSGRFGKVIASDFSKTMMTQTRNYCVEDLQLKKQTEGPNASLLFVRADVGRLPFASGSLDCVHAGAAMHCWPSPSVAVAEISRVLKPGGVFVASTFLDPTAVLGEFVGGDETVSSLSALFKDSGVGTGGAFNQFFSEPELRDLTTSVCGFERFQRKRNRQFVLFSVAKPKQSTESD